VVSCGFDNGGILSSPEANNAWYSLLPEGFPGLTAPIVEE
jgi:hypothetical protein